MRPPALRAWLDHGEHAVDLFAGGVDVPPEIRARFLSHVRRADGDACWEWQGFRQTRRTGARSYGLFCIKKKQFLAHRFAWMLTRGEIRDDLVVRHKCDNVACVRPDHLLIGTQADNLGDMWERGRGVARSFPLGTAHHGAKLDEEKIREIRRVREQTRLSFVKLGERYGLHPTTVYAIVKRKIWRHVA